MKVIFLDIDGVLNCEEAYRAGECKTVLWKNTNGDDDWHQSFCSWSKKWINLLIEETGAKIVISSTWRKSGIEYMRKVWELEGMSGKIIGITPDMRGYIEGYGVPRGCEIEKWLKDRGFSHINWSRELQEKKTQESGIENYIILDDDSDMLYGQRNHFVHVLPSPRNKRGFDETHYLQAKEILMRSVTEIVYPEEP